MTASRESPVDMLVCRLEQLHGVLNTLYLCRDDKTGEFMCTDKIIAETLDAGMELLEQARLASTELVSRGPR
jgi:hypothetical protein